MEYLSLIHIYKEIFAGKDKFEYSERMKKLNSDFAEVNRKWGMARGSSIAETGARHRTTEEYWDTLNLFISILHSVLAGRSVSWEG